MTTLQHVNSLDRTNPLLSSNVDWEAISSALNVSDLSDSDDTRLKAYHLIVWHCTDSYVGARAYFLDDKFVAISTQVGRKYGEEFEFTSQQDAEMVREYLLSLSGYKLEVKLINLNEESPDHYGVQYASQLIPQYHSYALYRGNVARVLSIPFHDAYVNFYIVEITYENSTKYVDVRALKFRVGAAYKDYQYFGPIKSFTREERLAISKVDGFEGI